jgi:DNA polymerase V
MTKKLLNENIKIVALSKIESFKECKIPFPEIAISAGFPSPAENFSENALDLNDLLIKHTASTFFIRVVGSSMINAGINSNDILIVDRSLSPAHDKIAIVRLNDEFTVKRIKLDGNKIFLVAENEQYQPIEITKEMDCEVWGIVTFVIHQV